MGHRCGNDYLLKNKCSTSSQRWAFWLHAWPHKHSSPQLTPPQHVPSPLRCTLIVLALLSWAVVLRQTISVSATGARLSWSVAVTYGSRQVEKSVTSIIQKQQSFLVFLMVAYLLWMVAYSDTWRSQVLLPELDQEMNMVRWTRSRQYQKKNVPLTIGKAGASGFAKSGSSASALVSE